MPVSAVSAVAGSLGAFITHVTVDAPLSTQWITWAGSDFLGTSIALPAALMIARPGRFGVGRAGRLYGLSIALSLALLTATVFGQQHYPVLILTVLMAVLLSTFMLSPVGVALVIVAVALISSGLTIKGLGPIAASEPTDVGERLLELLLFLASVAGSSLVGVALVAGQDRSRHSLARSLAAARAARKRADASVQAKAEFLANISHEIRTPLTVVIGFSDLLRKNTDLPERPRLYAERIARSGEALLAIVNNVLDFSRIESGQVLLRPEAINLKVMAIETVGQFQDMAKEKDLVLELRLDEPLPVRVMLDRGRVGQVLTNLVTNAIKFTRVGGVTIRLGYDQASQRARFSVSDTGIGIPGEKSDHIFERFTQIDGSLARQFGGVGLGLAISKTLVEAMGGQIGLESQEGVGATFHFTLPAPVDETGPDASAPVSDGRLLASLSVLVVEDVVMNRELIAAILRPYGVNVVEAGDGLEAVEAADREKFDLIVMDMQMPRMNGMSAAQMIRAESKFNRITSILALSADVLPQHVAQCLAAGMNDHLAKPIDPEELIAKIERWARP